MELKYVGKSRVILFFNSMFSFNCAVSKENKAFTVLLLVKKNKLSNNVNLDSRPIILTKFSIHLRKNSPQVKLFCFGQSIFIININQLYNSQKLRQIFGIEI